MKNVIYEHTLGHFYADEPGRPGNVVAVCGGEADALRLVYAWKVARAGSNAGIADARPRDVYISPHGTIWRVVARCDNPWIIADEMVESESGERSTRREGGVGGSMWDGFKRIHRPEGT